MTAANAAGSKQLGFWIVCAVAWTVALLAPHAARAQLAPGQPAPSASASASASPAPSASPVPAATQPPGTVRFAIDVHTTFTSQFASGPGVTPPEAAGFAVGDPLSPLTPYDVFSSAPLVSGNVSESALYVRPTYAARTVDLSLVLGAGYVRGSVTNAAHWGESLFAPLNPHLGSRALPYAIVFPTHAGHDDAGAFVASLLAGSVASKDGNFVLKGGWIDLTQVLPFVFVQPPVTNAPPAIGIATPESLGDGPPQLGAWHAPAAVLPLHGVDVVAKHAPVSLELTDAALPALTGTAARMFASSIVIDHGEGTKYAAEYLHVATGGEPISTTVLFGANGRVEAGPQGALPVSIIGGQRQEVFGASAAFHAGKALNGVVEIGRSTYGADDVARPGTGKPGNYAHAGATLVSAHTTFGLDVYRNDAYYANILLPYGTPENVWSVAWSWPGQWLKSNYQLINDAPVNINREGYRLKYTMKSGPVDLRAAYARFDQIAPITFTNALQTGFIDGFFLPQSDAAATRGLQHQYLLFAGWHARFGDLTVDFARDTMRRPAAPGHPGDLVAYDNPEYVLTFSRNVATGALAAVGLARYGMRGSFGQSFTNVDFAERIAFAGVEFRQSAHATALLSLRRTTFGGFPSMLGGPPPDFRATSLVFEQRYSR